MTKTVLTSLSFLCTLSISEFTSAAENHHAHVHGVADLTVAYDRQVLEIQFESPAISILGFEHRPKSLEQEQIIENTKALLNAPEKILSIEGASCSPNSVEVSITGPASQSLNDQDNKSAHDHDSHENHTDHHDENHKQSSTHSEVLALYVFDCSAKQPNSVTTSFFDHFSGLEKINVSWLTETQQGQSVLRATSTTVSFK